MKPLLKTSSRSEKPALALVPNPSQLEILKGFSSSDLEWIQKHCAYQFFEPGDSLFLESNPLLNVFFILKGHVKFCKRGSRGEEITFSLFGEGDIFELVMSDQPEKHLFSAYALSETVALKVSPLDFRRHFMKNTTFANRILYQKIRTIKRLFFSRLVAGESVEIRMASLILDIIQRKGMAHQDGKALYLDIPLTRRDIAQIVNTSVETSIRVIRRWIKKGLVTVDHRHLIIHDVAAFKKIVSKLPRLPD